MPEERMHEYLEEPPIGHDYDTHTKGNFLQQTHPSQMVLNKKPDKEPLRFFFGIFIIALSIYAYYMGTSMRNSPELFLLPEAIKATELPCSLASSDSLSACIPAGIDFSGRGDAIEFYSARKQLRGPLKS